MQWIFIDVSSTATQDLRANQNSTGIANQSISKCVEGISSKIHLIVNAHGNAIDFKIRELLMTSKLHQI